MSARSASTGASSSVTLTSAVARLVTSAVGIELDAPKGRSCEIRTLDVVLRLRQEAEPRPLLEIRTTVQRFRAAVGSKRRDEFVADNRDRDLETFQDE